MMSQARRPMSLAAATLAVSAVSLMMALLLYGLSPISTYDIWWHLKTGEQMWTTGSLLDTDPFSHTHAGAPWPYKDAGADLLLYGVYALAGPAGLVVLKAVGFGLAMLAVVAILRRQRSAPWSLIAVLMAAMISAVAFRFTERPAFFSHGLTALVLWLLERHRRGKRGLWWSVPLTMVMANLHRGVLIVPALLAVYTTVCGIEAWLSGARLADKKMRQAGGVLLGCTLATAATPFGVALWSKSIAIMSSIGFRGTIPEWQPTSLSLLWAATPATLWIAVGAMVAWGVRWHRWRRDPGAFGADGLWDAALCVLGIIIAMRGVRFSPYFVLFVIPHMATGLGYLGWLWSGRLRHTIAVAAGTAAWVVALGTPFSGVDLGVAKRRYPEAAVSRVLELGDELRGPMLNEFGLGGYLIWNLWPAHRVYIDGRNDVFYPADFIERYGRLLGDARLFATETQRYGIEWLFLHHRPLAGARAHIDMDPAWALIFVSARGLLYVKREGVNAALATHLGYRYLAPHALAASIERAWGLADGAHRDAVVAEARRMVREDPDSILAHLALASCLSRMGPIGASELNGIAETLGRISE